MHDSWKDLAVDIGLDNQELRKIINDLRDEINQVKRENCDLRMQLVFARQKLRKEHLTVGVVVDDNRYECDKCCASLEGDFSFCPGCGCYIDWSEIDDGDNWYAEESERFVNHAVYEPLRQVLQK